MIKPSRISRMKSLKSYKPAVSFSLRGPGKPADGFVEVLPVKRYWPIILLLVGVLIAFCIPLFTLDINIGEMEDLFDLTYNLFEVFWAFGWVIGILFLVGVILALLLANEILIVEPDRIRQRIEVKGLGFETVYPLACICNLRYVDDDSDEGNRWRGNHLTFDYLKIPISFGSYLSPKRARELVDRITATLNHPVPPKLASGIDDLLENNQPLPELQEKVTPVRVPGDSVAPPGEAGSGKLSMILLVGANLVPIAGIFLLDWSVADIVLLFWLESAIIGFFNILKMFRIAGPLAIFFSIFFVGHFGAFMAVHLMFIFALFIETDNTSMPLAEVLAIFRNMWPAILALFISHAISFKQNFLGKKEYLRLTIGDQMHKPYSRIVLMHVTLIVGGFLVLALDSSFLPLVLLIVLKMAVDIGAHLKEHRN